MSGKSPDGLVVWRTNEQGKDLPTDTMVAFTSVPAPPNLQPLSDALKRSGIT